MKVVARLFTLIVVSLVGLVFMGLGGSLVIAQREGRAGHVLLCLLGVMVEAIVVVAAVYGAD